LEKYARETTNLAAHKLAHELPGNTLQATALLAHHKKLKSCVA
jgi:hypothetical protein